MRVVVAIVFFISMVSICDASENLNVLFSNRRNTYEFGNNNINKIDTKLNLEFISKTILPVLKKNIHLQLDAGAEIVMIFDSSLNDLDSITFKDLYLNFLKDIALSFPQKVGYYSTGKTRIFIKNIK